MENFSFKRRTPGEKVFFIFNGILMVFICFITIYPFINTMALSFSEGAEAMRGRVYFFPRVATWQNYKTVFNDNEILRGYAVTVTRTTLGILTTLFCTGCLAYGLSKKYLVGRKFYILICVVSMIFHAGLIPTYMLYKDMGLLNNFLVYILPGAVSTFNMILMKNYFEHMPEELEESAMIDGASTMRVVFSIVLPLAMPIIATISIFTGVGQWNSWFDAYMFVPKKTEIHPLQTYLYRVISLSQIATQDPQEMQLLERMRVNVTTVRSATVMITTIPIIFIYALFQKHFIKGAMVGALKG